MDESSNLPAFDTVPQEFFLTSLSPFHLDFLDTSLQIRLSYFQEHHFDQRHELKEYQIIFMFWLPYVSC